MPAKGRRRVISSLLVLGAAWPAAAIAQAYPVWSNHVPMEAGDYISYLETPDFVTLAVWNAVTVVVALILAIFVWRGSRPAVLATTLAAGACLSVWILAAAQFALYEWIYLLIFARLYLGPPGFPPPVALPLLLLSAWVLTVRGPDQDAKAKRRRFVLLALLFGECAAAMGSLSFALGDYEASADTETWSGAVSAAWPEAFAFVIALALLIAVARRVPGSFYLVTALAAFFSLVDVGYAVTLLPSGGAGAIGGFVTGPMPWAITPGLIAIPTLIVCVSLLAGQQRVRPSAADVRV